MFRPSDHRALTVPIHSSKTLPKGTFRAIVKQAGLAIEEFMNLS